MKFGSKGVSWIRCCISTVHFSNLVDGNFQASLKVLRGSYEEILCSLVHFDSGGSFPYMKANILYDTRKENLQYLSVILQYLIGKSRI